MALVPQFQKFKASLTTNILWKWIAWSLDWWFDLHIWEFRCGLAFSLENDKCDSTSDGISNFQRPLKPHNFGNSTYSSSWLILKCLAASTEFLHPQNHHQSGKQTLNLLERKTTGNGTDPPFYPLSTAPIFKRACHFLSQKTLFFPLSTLSNANEQSTQIIKAADAKTLRATATDSRSREGVGPGRRRSWCEIL